MENRFLDAEESFGKPARRSQRRQARSGGWARPFSAVDRRLVILIENGGVDLGIPRLVDEVLSRLPGASVIPASYRERLVEHIRQSLRRWTDQLLETAELTLNRYTGARPEFFGDVIVLRDGTASYDDLKTTLHRLTREGKIIDLLILTHGTTDYISVRGMVDGARIRQMRTELGRPLALRSVYMMNCIGSSLNAAWLDAGAKVSAGSRGNNYLPEPTTYFFWRNWKAGQPFETAVTAAYRRTVELMNEALRGFVSTIPVAAGLASRINVSSLDFVAQSAPLVAGQGTVTISSDNLTFSQSVSSGLVTTVVPAQARAMATPEAASRRLSPEGLDLIREWEGQSGGGADPVQLGRRAEAAQQAVNDSVTTALNQNQNDALVSFVVNVGAERFRRSTLLQLLNGGDFAAVPAELRRWTRSQQNGSVVELPALARRRQAEADLFSRSATTGALSLPSHSYRYEGPSSLALHQSLYSMQQNPVLIAGITVAEAAQIGLGAAAMVQTQVIASQGTFSLTYDRAQRLLTTEARTQMPGAQVGPTQYSARLFHIGMLSRPGLARAEVIIEWQGNPYGEIGTPTVRKELTNSTEWTHSSVTIAITNVAQIPIPSIDPRAWPLTYRYEGTYDPLGNGYYEFSGEFEINAFGGLRFNRHQVVSRSFLDATLAGTPEDRVRKGQDLIVPIPTIPQDQVQYLRSRLP
jgi:GH24 family phage-related lysozyme (muramidase)